MKSATQSPLLPTKKQGKRKRRNSLPDVSSMVPRSPGRGPREFSVQVDQEEENDQQLLAPLASEFSIFLSISWPIALSMFCRLVMALTDASILGYLGTEFLAGCSVAWVWMDITGTFSWSLIDALNTLCSQAFGAGQYKLVGRWLHIALLICSIVSIPVGLSWFLTEKVLLLLGVDARTAELANTFAVYSALWLLPDNWYYAFRQYFIAQEIVMPAMINNMIFVVINLLLNLLLVHGLSFGSVHWAGLGYIGSPLATAISRILQFICFLLYTMVWKKLHVKTWPPLEFKTFSKKRMAKFMRFALPTMVSNALEQWQLEIITLFATRLGTLALATQSGIFNVFYTLHCLIFGFSKATVVRVGHHLGASRPQSAKQAAYISVLIAAFCGVLVALILYFSSDFSGRIYSNDVDVVNLNGTVQWAVGLAYIAVCLMMSLTSTISGQGRPTIIAVLSAICTWGVSVPCSYVFTFPLKKGILGLWLGMLLGYSSIAILAAFLLFRSDWERYAEGAVLEANEAAGHSPQESGDTNDLQSSQVSESEPLVQ